VKRMQLGLVLLLCSAALGCGSSGGTLSATQDSCTAYCNTYIAAGCRSPFYSSASACVNVECVPLKGGSSSCQTALKAYYDCEQAQADICGDTGCASELAALNGC
jgi:hypothetical protein